MAQFYAEIQGNRGQASRMGTKGSGIHGHIRGWDTGVRVSVLHQGGEDVVRVFRTGGSNGAFMEHQIAEFTPDTPRGEEGW